MILRGKCFSLNSFQNPIVMYRPYIQISLFFLSLLALLSCDTNIRGGGRGAIVLGDSSTIVTETDPQYLHHAVADIHVLPLTEDSNATAGRADTFRSAPPEKAARSSGEGLKVAFKELTVFIPEIKTRTYTRQDPQTSSGVSYQLTEGTLKDRDLHITGNAAVEKISQRYMTTVILENGNNSPLILENLNYTSSWKEIPGEQGIYPVTGIEENSLSYTKASPSTIRNAVNQAIKKKRLSKNAAREWQQKAEKVSSVNQKPLSVILRSVMWKIEGKDAQGKPFVKQLRIDL